MRNPSARATALLAIFIASTIAVIPARAATPTTLTVNPYVVTLRVLTPGTALDLGFGGGPTVSATLRAGGSPVAGKQISFITSDGRSICDALTGADGVAYCSVQATVLGLPVTGFTARFAGDETYSAASGSGGLGESIVDAGDLGGCWVQDPDRGLIGCGF